MDGYTWDSTGKLLGPFALPYETQAVGYAFFLAPDGGLYHYGTKFAGGVASATGFHDDALNADQVTFFDSTGAGYVWRSNGSLTPADTYPAGTIAVGNGFFLTPSGVLYHYGASVA
ncbi:hypothetical protein QCD70_18970, partial [Agreia sp. PsM10]|uniref:hypothetical protein n=1 Tax=Agreia sp. PsM10 TaxID=3030533 RepID=UPI00263B2E37